MFPQFQGCSFISETTSGFLQGGPVTKPAGQSAKEPGAVDEQESRLGWDLASPASGQPVGGSRLPGGLHVTHTSTKSYPPPSITGAWGRGSRKEGENTFSSLSWNLTHSQWKTLSLPLCPIKLPSFMLCFRRLTLESPVSVFMEMWRICLTGGLSAVLSMRPASSMELHSAPQGSALEGELAWATVLGLPPESWLLQTGPSVWQHLPRTRLTDFLQDIT